jgi:nucleoside-diphosphate-sugar epimerase
VDRPARGIRGIECGDLAAVDPEQLDEWLDGVDVVYHLAGRAHRRDRGNELQRYALYRRDNVMTTAALFAAAQRNAVRRFIYLSSIKVLGDVSTEPFHVSTRPDPRDVYAQTKLEAERQLQSAVSRGTAAAVSTASAGRMTSVFGRARKCARCSTGWCVGPSSPIPMESCVST